MQADLFSNGADADTVRSLPPYLDPARVSIVLVDREEDRDHVAAAVAGVLPVGALGNNRSVFVVRVLDKDEKTLHADSFPTYSAASNYSAWISAKLDGHRQRDLFAELPAGHARFEASPADGSDLPLFSS